MDRVEYEKLIVQDLINLHKNGELNLTPWYQRRSVWTPPQKAYLINSILEQKPIPTIYVRHSLDIQAELSIREVVDGQQRIRSILEFVDNSFAVRHPNYAKRMKYSELKKSDAQTFRLTSMSVGYLLGATDADVIEIFGRLNSVAKQLNGQEKRNARFSGEYKQFCLKQASDRVAMWRDLNLFSANDIARMSEVQFISELALNLLVGLSDFSASGLDKIYFEFDEDFPRRKEIESRFEQLFTQIASLNISSIRDTVFSRLPLFFSLAVLLGQTKKAISTKRMENGLHEIDEILNSDLPLSERSRSEADFISACTSTTQRIKQRRIRHDFIKTRIGL